MVEVCCNARLHDARHVSYWCKTARASCEKRQNREAPPLPVQPGDYVSSERLACRHTHSIQQGQGVAEQAAERHVPLLQTCLWRGKGKKWYSWGDIKKKTNKHFFPFDGWGGRLTRWVECHNALQNCLQLSLQAVEADAASLLQSDQRLNTPAHVHCSLQRLLLPDERNRLFCLFGLKLYRNRYEYHMIFINKTDTVEALIF